MTNRPELRVNSVARPSAGKTLRHALAAFLETLAIESECAEDILSAVGEALANAIEHAYGSERTPGQVELRAQLEEDGILLVSVADRGRFIQRAPRPGRGFGLRIARAIAREVSLETENGTHIRMTFRTTSRLRSVVS